MLLLLATAFAGPLDAAWGNKPVLHVTLLNRWGQLQDCGVAEGSIAALQALAWETHLASEELRWLTDDWLRTLPAAEGQARLRELDQPGQVAALSAWEAHRAEELLGTATPCAMALLEEFWAVDSRRGLPPPGEQTVAYEVYATQFDAHTSDEVAIPDKCIKFDNLGWSSCGSGYGEEPYYVTMTRGNKSATIFVGDVGPWNIDDNFWNAKNHAERPRRLFTDLPEGLPEAQAAYYDDYNGGQDQYGRTVGNPAGLDLATEVAGELGLAYLQNDWVVLQFPWETVVTPDPEPDLALTGSLLSLDQPRDAVPEGSSAGIFDLWTGQVVIWELTLTNSGDASAGTVRVGLSGAGDGLTIDRVLVDGAEVGDIGDFSLGALAQGASATARVELRATQASAATVEVLARLIHADAGYEALETSTRVDAWGRRTWWDFDASLLGWWAESGTIGLSEGILLVEGPAVLVSPPLAIDAQDWLALHLEASGPGGQATLTWEGDEGEASLPTSGGGSVPIEGSGAVERLRLSLPQGDWRIVGMTLERDPNAAVAGNELPWERERMGGCSTPAAPGAWTVLLVLLLIRRES